MTKIILVRHGQTDWNLVGRWQGSADIPLNKRGLEQAEAVAQRLADWPIDAIYSSPQKRAAQTANVIAMQHPDLTVQVEPNWREKDAGDCEGMTRAEVQAMYPTENISFGAFVAPNGESFESVSERVVRAFNQIEAQHPHETVLVVSHGGTMATLIAHVLRLSRHESWRFTAGHNTGLSRLERTERGWRLTRLNDTSHLE